MPSRILVVEDDEKSRRLLADVLGHHGHEVAACASGEEALREARRQAPHAALLDIQLPGISGFEVLEGLRAVCGEPRLPVLAVTASVMEHERARILAAGFDAYVAKPVNIRQLIGILEEILRKVAP